MHSIVFWDQITQVSKMKKISVMCLTAVLVIFPACGDGKNQNRPVNPLVTPKINNYVPDLSVSKNDLLTDINFYVSKTIEVHASPYRIITQEEFNTLAEKIRNEIRDRDTDTFDLFECYFYLQKLAAAIADGHTKIYEPENWEKMFDLFFPLNIAIFERRVFVTKNAGESDIPEKAEITAINGKHMQDLLAAYRTFCEGTLDHYRDARLPEYFRFFLHTYTRAVSPWVIEYSAKGQPESATVKGINLKDLQKRTTVSRRHKESSVQIAGEETPVLHLPSIGYSKDYFKPFIDKFFETHRDRKNIILDFRRCPGGNGLRTYDILDHVADTPYSNSKRFAFRASQPLKEKVGFNIRTAFYDRGISLENWQERFFAQDLYSDAYNEIYRTILNAETGTFAEIPGDFGRHEPDNTIEKYKGNLFILISHRTFSAGVVFASTVKHNKLGTIVGRETGGRLDFFSDTVDIELPSTGLVAKIPSAILTLYGDNQTRGVIPDRAVKYTVEDFLSGRDPDIEAVKEIVSQTQSMKKE